MPDDAIKFPTSFTTPEISIAFARVSPPPISNKMPHDSLVMLSQSNKKPVLLLTSGIINNSKEPPIPIMVSFKKGILNQSEINVLKIHPNAVKANTVITPYSWKEIFPKLEIFSEMINEASGKDVISDLNSHFTI